MNKQKILIILLSLISLASLVSIYYLLGLPLLLVILTIIITITGFALFLKTKGITKWTGFTLFGIGLFVLLTAGGWLRTLVNSQISRKLLIITCIFKMLLQDICQATDVILSDHRERRISHSGKSSRENLRFFSAARLTLSRCPSERMTYGKGVF